MISGIHHVSIPVVDTARALDFYCGILGLSVDATRPDLGFAGAWLRVGEQQIHLLELPTPDPREGRPQHVGRDRHMALTVTALTPLEAALQHSGVPYRRSRSGRVALFCRDPDGNGIELVEAAGVGRK